MGLKNVLDFLRFTNKFRMTQRAIFAVNDGRMENDVEHSYQLAVLSWYLIESLNLRLDVSLVTKYALIHDLDEVFDGDKHIFDTAGRVDKERKAKLARKRTSTLFPAWEGYRKLAQNYVEQKDEESQFVWALDKILPVMNIYLDGGRSWQNERTDLKMIVANKRDKVSKHPVSQRLWEQLEPLLRKRERELFGIIS